MVMEVKVKVHMDATRWQHQLVITCRTKLHACVETEMSRHHRLRHDVTTQIIIPLLKQKMIKERYQNVFT